MTPILPLPATLDGSDLRNDIAQKIFRTIPGQHETERCDKMRTQTPAIVRNLNKHERMPASRREQQV